MRLYPGCELAQLASDQRPELLSAGWLVLIKGNENVDDVALPCPPAMRLLLPEVVPVASVATGKLGFGHHYQVEVVGGIVCRLKVGCGVSDHTLIDGPWSAAVEFRLTSDPAAHVLFPGTIGLLFTTSASLELPLLLEFAPRTLIMLAKPPARNTWSNLAVQFVGKRRRQYH